MYQLLVSAGLDPADVGSFELKKGLGGKSIVFSGGTIAFSRFAEAAGSDGNISADPVLVMTGGSSKPIYSLANDSPCCNAGFRLPWSDDATDLAGNPRRVGRTVDMGCYENPLAIGLQLFVR